MVLGGTVQGEAKEVLVEGSGRIERICLDIKTDIFDS